MEDFDDLDPAKNPSSGDLVDPDDIKHEEAESPAVKDEQAVFSGDAPESGESYDIGEELGKVGLSGDDPNQTPDPLGVSQEIDNDEQHH